MGKYYDNLDEKYRSYFKVLSNEFPSWLEEYIETAPMQKIGKISMDCGKDYTCLFKKHPWHSNLEHSVGVALIIWNFTKDKKQTLAGLFHDIATPCFKHCIDYMNGDSEHQESTEERTKDIISGSEEIMYLLKRDGISVNEVCDYKLYPIADNDTPKLSADRFEYNFSCGYFIYSFWDLDNLKRCYEDVVILKNEDSIPELGFKNLDIATKYIETISKLWPYWIDEKTRVSMQFFADICKAMDEEGYLTVDDLYTLTEEEVINKIKSCENENIRLSFEKFQKTDKCYISNSYVPNKYCINVKSKRRYINPLVVKNKTILRAYDLSKNVKEKIDNYLKLPVEGYVYLDFKF